MRTSLFCLLLLALPALGQGLAERIEQALKPDTEPEQRNTLLRRILADSGGAATLAERGLDPALDSEVVHAVVAALFRAGKHLDHLDGVCRLLLHDTHRSKIRRRFVDLGDDPALRKDVVDRLATFATGKDAAASGDAQLRLASIRGLDAIAWRPALEAIVAAWTKEEDRAVKDECRAVLVTVLDAKDGAEADRYLKRRPYASYADLLRERNAALKLERDKLDKYRRLALERADAATAFSVFGNGDVEAKRIAAERLLALAEAKQWDKMAPEEFAARVLDIFRSERGRSDKDAPLIATLGRALAQLWRGGDAAPLRKAVKPEDLVAAVQPLAGGGSELADAGRACVDLLGELGDGGKAALVEFARGFGDTDVRVAAVQKLGVLATRSATSRDYIGRSLAEMLASGEKSPAVRSQLIFTLARSFDGVPADRLPVAQWVREPESAPKLSPRDLRYCIELIAKSGSADALDTLLEASLKHPENAVRLLAATDGLLPWLDRDPKVAPRVLGHIRGIALSAAQPEALRIDLVKALGASARRDVHGALRDIEQDESAAASVRAAAGAARIQLAQGLLSTAGGRTVAREDIDVAVAILDDMTDPAERESLAAAIVLAADGAKLPARNARYVLARIKAGEEGVDEETARTLLHEAATRAEADGLDAKSRRELHADLLRRAVDGKRFKDASEHSVALAKLANGDKREVASLLADAAEFSKLAGDKPRALELVKAARTDGAPDSDVATRLAELEKALSGSGS